MDGRPFAFNRSETRDVRRKRTRKWWRHTRASGSDPAWLGPRYYHEESGMEKAFTYHWFSYSRLPHGGTQKIWLKESTKGSPVGQALKKKAPHYAELFLAWPTGERRGGRGTAVGSPCRRVVENRGFSRSEAVLTGKRPTSGRNVKLEKPRKGFFIYRLAHAESRALRGTNVWAKR